MADEGDAQRLAEDARLWGHMLHENSILFSGNNLFLVGQSLFAVAYTTLLTSGEHLSAARLLATFGLVMALVCMFVCHRQFHYYRVVQDQAQRRLPEFAVTRATWARKPIALLLITYGLPLMAAILWLSLLFVT
ncbi:hypothetical protein ACWGII_00200 [Streptomyces sp. NPDC054855]